MMKSTVVSVDRRSIFYAWLFRALLANYKIRSNDQGHIEIEKSAKYTDLFACPVRAQIHVCRQHVFRCQAWLPCCRR